MAMLEDGGTGVVPGVGGVPGPKGPKGPEVQPDPKSASQADPGKKGESDPKQNAGTFYKKHNNAISEDSLKTDKTKFNDPKSKGTKYVNEYDGKRVQANIVDSTSIPDKATVDVDGESKQDPQVIKLDKGISSYNAIPGRAKSLSVTLPGEDSPINVLYGGYLPYIEKNYTRQVEERIIYSDPGFIGAADANTPDTSTQVHMALLKVFIVFNGKFQSNSILHRIGNGEVAFLPVDIVAYLLDQGVDVRLADTQEKLIRDYTGEATGADYGKITTVSAFSTKVEAIEKTAVQTEAETLNKNVTDAITALTADLTTLKSKVSPAAYRDAIMERYNRIDAIMFSIVQLMKFADQKVSSSITYTPGSEDGKTKASGTVADLITKLNTAKDDLYKALIAK